MTVGGLGYYNPKFEGFVEDNNPTAGIQHAGWMDVVVGTSDGYQRDLIDLLLHMTAESGNYGAGWINISNSFPVSPALGRPVARINLDESSDTRIYIYNGSSWKYLEFI